MWTITGHHLSLLEMPANIKTGLDCRTTDVAAAVNEMTQMEESLFIQFNPEGGKDSGGQQCLKDAANIFLLRNCLNRFFFLALSTFKHTDQSWEIRVF